MLSPYHTDNKFCHSELLKLDILLKQILFNNSKLSVILYDYIFSSSKRIRAKLLFLVLNSLGIKVTSEHLRVAAVTEITHNASLIHDDIIDESKTRRGKSSLNFEFDNKLAVIGGDYLLSIALNNIISLKNESVMDNYITCLNQMLEAEASQYFTKNEIPTIEQYIEKSKQKTALLFEATIKNGLLLSEKKATISTLGRFAINFGIAFQIANDINNIEEDIENGIFTAPLIYLNKVISGLKHKSQSEMITLLKNSDCIAQTKNLLNKHIRSAIDILSFIEDNQHKANLISFCSELYED